MGKRIPRSARSCADRNYVPKKRSPLSTAKVITRDRSRSPSASRSPCPRKRSPIREDSTTSSSSPDGDSGPPSSKSSPIEGLPAAASSPVSNPSTIKEIVSPIGTTEFGSLILHLALPQPQTQGQAQTQPPPPAQAQATTLRVRPTTLHGFPKLPPSVRQCIWKYILPCPRNLVVRLNIRQQQHRQPIKLDYEVSLGCYPFVALNLKALLETCRESRGAALRSYKRLLGPTPQIVELPKHTEAQANAADNLYRLKRSQNTRNFYYSPTHDTLLFSEETFMKFCWTRKLISTFDIHTLVPGSDVQKIMLRVTYTNYKEGMVKLLTRFGGLRYLGLCWDDSSKHWKDRHNIMTAEKVRLGTWIEKEWEGVKLSRAREVGVVCQIEVMPRRDMDRRAG